MWLWKGRRRPFTLQKSQPNAYVVETDLGLHLHRFVFVPSAAGRARPHRRY